MKKALSLLLISLTLVFAGCSDDDTDDLSFNIVRGDVEFAASGGTGTIEFIADGSIVPTSDRTWITFSSTGGTSVAFTVAANDGIMSRTGNITLTSGSVSQTLAVTQLGTILDTEPTYRVGALARTTMFEIYSNNEAVTVTAADSWVNVSFVDGNLIITPELNTGEERSTILTISSGWKTTTATIVQAKLVLVDISSVSLDGAGNVYSFDINSDISEVDKVWEITSADSWLHIEKDEYTMNVTADLNETGLPRNSEITITAGEVTITIPVVQSGIVDYYKYFLGQWALRFDGGASTQPVIFIENEYNRSYIMRGLGFDTLILYNSSTRRMSLVVQDLELWSGYLIRFLPWDNVAGYITTQAGTGFNLVFNEDEMNPAIALSDNGVWGTYISRGIYYMAYNPDTGASAGYVTRYASVVEFFR